MFTKGGQTAGIGTYWDMSTGSRVDLAAEGILPGDERTGYIKAPSALVLLAGPVLGLVFAVFLPFIGIAMAVMLVAKKTGAIAARAAAQSASFGWKPVEAYLAGRKQKKAAMQRKVRKDR